MHRFPTRILGPLAIGCATLLLAAAVQARPGGRPGGRHHDGPPPMGRFLERHAEELGLDEETRARIEEITEASREQGDALKVELHAAHEAMRAMLDMDPINEDAVLAQADHIGELETERRKSRLLALMQIQRLLTPEQRAALASMRESRPHGRRGAGPFAALRDACGEDRLRLCGQLPPGRASHQCLLDSGDSLSEACTAAILALPVRPEDASGPGVVGVPASGDRDRVEPY